MRRSQAYLDHREKWILDTVQANETISIEEVIAQFDVSPSTVRKQLNNMHSEGLIIRTHGGAVCVKEKKQNAITLLAQKQAIAKAARAYVKDGSAIAIGTGTTTLCFAETLHDVKDLRVITDSVPIANALYGNENIEVRVCGGVVKTLNGAIVGPQAGSFFENVYVEQAFVGVDKVAEDFGVTSKDVYVSFSERGIVLSSREVFVLADYTKMGGEAYVDRLATFSEINHIITNEQADEIVVGKLKNMNLNIVLA